MEKNKKRGYFRHIIKKNYDHSPAAEQILDDIIKYNEKITRDNYNIIFSFDEFCPNIDRRVDLSYIDPNEISGSHSHDFYELIYVKKGALLQYIDGESFIMESGSLLFLHPTIIHSFYSYNETRAVNILVKKEYLERFTVNVNARIKNCFLNRIANEKSFVLFVAKNDNNIIEPLIDRICEISELNNLAKKFMGVKNLGGSSMSDVLITEQILHQLLLTIIKGVEENCISEKMVSASRTNADTAQIIEYMRENYKDITVEKLSKKFGYSTAQLYRIIKKTTGNNFNTIVITIRIQRAKYLLRNTDYSISQIANLVGLGSSEYFSRLFSRQIGYTPTEYRKMQKNNVYLPYDVNPNLLNKNK